MAITISIANQKGGAGKTTTAVCLAGALAQQKKKVLLIDGDNQTASASLIFGADNEICGLTALFMNDPFEVLKTPNFDVLPSNHILAQTALTLSNTKMAQARNRKLKDALKANGVFDKYDYIIIDCPPSHDVITYNALWASDYCIIPMRPDELHFAALEDMLAIIEVAQEQGANVLPLGTLLICYDKRLRLHSLISEKIEKAYPKLRFRTTIRNNVHLAEMASFRKDIFEHFPTSNGALDYTDLAKEVAKRAKSAK